MPCVRDFLSLFFASIPWSDPTWLFRWEEAAVMGWHDNTFSAGAVDYHRMCVADLSTPCPAQYNTPQYATCFKALTTAKNRLFASEITGGIRRAILLAIVSSQHSSRSCEMGRVLLTAARNAITVGSRKPGCTTLRGEMYILLTYNPDLSIVSEEFFRQPEGVCESLFNRERESLI